MKQSSDQDSSFYRKLGIKNWGYYDRSHFSIRMSVRKSRPKQFLKFFILYQSIFILMQLDRMMFVPYYKFTCDNLFVLLQGVVAKRSGHTNLAINKSAPIYNRDKTPFLANSLSFGRISYVVVIAQWNWLSITAQNGP